MRTFLQVEDFAKAISKLRPAQRPLGWQNQPTQKAQQVLLAPYQPKPAHSITLKNNRQLTVPSAEDRIIQGAVLQALIRNLPPSKSQGAHAIAHELAQQLANRKNCWVLQCDIRKFFSSLDRKSVILALNSACPTIDDWTLHAIDALLQTTPTGLPQGSPLSPLLAELAMTDVDKELQKNQGIRYVDDIVILTNSPQEAELQAAKLSRLVKPLGLELNSSKTTITHYPETPFTFLGAQYPPAPEQAILVKAASGSLGLGLPQYRGETPAYITITEGGPSRQTTATEVIFSKEYFLRSLTDKPTLDSILLLASVHATFPSKWGQKLFEHRNKFLSSSIAKPLHDSAFKLYVGKVKPKQNKADPSDAARVLQALIVGNEILRTGQFPTSFASMSSQYQNAMEELQAGNYEQYRKVVSELFKKNYPLRQHNTLPVASAYEESIVEHNIDVLEIENISLP